MNIYAIIPARSGSKGVPDKNIRKVAGKELIGHAIEFAKKLPVTKIICSTDSEHYAEIARQYGAEVPFLRSAAASHDTAMEQDILEDLYNKFDEHDIAYPDIFVWLRPTFVFRDVDDVTECITRLRNEPQLTSCRVVVEAESRLYHDENGLLKPNFDDKGKSMIRRQEVEKAYRVYLTDVFRGVPKNCGADFLGNRVGYVVANKLCGIDIDDEQDLFIATKMIESLSHE
ncbi:MAG: acylneuraminate cytidylyltransferase family protein [Candidatus Pacebacteria bacterium]|nr:acylneuraminate cytidylyltransferase family protein [Candidatus Paceibacterota bacterium]